MKILLLPIILFSIFTTAAGMKAGEATQPKAGTQLQVRTVYPTSYDELIEKIVQAERYGFPENECLEISDEFRFLNEYEVHGYLLMDLDGDGSDELLLGLNSVDEADPNESWDSIIYDIFTMKKGRMLHAVTGGARCRYYLCENGMLANEGSNGAAYSSWEYYTYKAGNLDIVESIFTSDDMEQQMIRYYHSDQESYKDYSHEITDDEAWRIIKKHKYRKLEFAPFTEKH